jgi:hypothetical protein
MVFKGTLIKARHRQRRFKTTLSKASRPPPAIATSFTSHSKIQYPERSFRITPKEKTFDTDFVN